MKKIISIEGNKGGVGKSMLCSTVIDTLQQNKKGEIFVIETDLKTADIGKAYANAPYITNCAFIDLSNSDGFIELSEIVQESSADYFVINNCAGGASEWIKYGQAVTESLKEIDAKLLTLWALGLERDSVEDAKAYYETLVADNLNVEMIPVISLFFARQETFYVWNRSNIRKEVLENNGNKEIVFPATAKRITIEMREKRRRWDDEDNLPIAHKFEIKRFRKAAWLAIEPFL